MNDLELINRYYLIDELYRNGFDIDYLKTLTNEQLKEKLSMVKLGAELFKTSILNTDKN
jgi:hypothetical protein